MHLKDTKRHQPPGKGKCARFNRVRQIKTWFTYPRGIEGWVDIGVGYTPCPEKNIPNIIDCRSKKCLPILIIFGTNISGTTGHQMIGQFTTSPNVCFCTIWKKWTNDICVEMNKNTSKSILNIIVWLEEKFINFNNFWCKHFWHNCPSNDCVT